MDELLTALRRAPAFAELDEAALGAVAREAELQEFASGATIWEQGTVPLHVQILLEGRVGLTVASETIGTTILDVVEPVDILFLAAVLMNAPTLMGARALSPSRMLLLPAESFRETLGRAPQLSMSMLASLSGQYRLMVRQIKDLKLRSAAQRLGCYLLGLARAQGGGELVRLPYDKRVLAAQLGATPEHLSRAFATLRAHGVDTRGSSVRITDPTALTAFAAPDPPG
jgi:CRP/FNR family transcriptional activator FtrB